MRGIGRGDVKNLLKEGNYLMINISCFICEEEIF